MRLVSLAPSSTEIVLGLGLGQKLCGVSAYCKTPRELQGLRRLHGWTSIQAKEVLELKPDLVLSSSICQEPLAEELRKGGLEVLHVDPRRLEEVAQSFVTIATPLGKSSEGLAMAEKFRDELAALSQKPRDPQPRVYIEEWHDPPMVAGNWVPELIRCAGAEAFNRDLGHLSQAISWEELMEFDPEWVLYSICGVGLHFDPQAFLETEGWKDLSAARAARVYSVEDSLFNVPGPGLLEGLKLLRALLDGELPKALRGLASAQTFVRKS